MLAFELVQVLKKKKIVTRKENLIRNWFFGIILAVAISVLENFIWGKNPNVISSRFHNLQVNHPWSFGSNT
jgi:hypothetical protein